jgi:hypothetical protein
MPFPYPTLQLDIDAGQPGQPRLARHSNVLHAEEYSSRLRIRFLRSGWSLAFPYTSGSRSVWCGTFGAHLAGAIQATSACLFPEWRWCLAG